MVRKVDVLKMQVRATASSISIDICDGPRMRWLAKTMCSECRRERSRHRSRSIYAMVRKVDVLKMQARALSTSLSIDIYDGSQNRCAQNAGESALGSRAHLEPSGLPSTPPRAPKSIPRGAEGAPRDPRSPPGALQGPPGNPPRRPGGLKMRAGRPKHPPGEPTTSEHCPKLPSETIRWLTLSKKSVRNSFRLDS